MNSLQDQVVAIADFAARNDLEVGSADHEYRTVLRCAPGRMPSEMDAAARRTSSSRLRATWRFCRLRARQARFIIRPCSGGSGSRAQRDPRRP